MKLSCAALRPLLAARERGALPLVEAAWGVTARKSSHNASNARGVAAGKMGRNSSFISCILPDGYIGQITRVNQKLRH